LILLASVLRLELQWMREAFFWDHLLYLAIIPLIGPLVSGLSRIPWSGRARLAGTATAVALLTALFVLTRQQAVLYSDERLLLYRTLACFPQNARAECRLGRLELTVGNIDAAAEHFASACETDRHCMDAMAGLAEVFALRGEFARAL